MAAAAAAGDSDDDAETQARGASSTAVGIAAGPKDYEGSSAVSDSGSPSAAAEAATPDDDDIPLPINHGPSPQFRMLVVFFEHLINMSGVGIGERRRALVEGFIRQWREKVGDDLYPAFALVMPHIDADGTRQLYRLKERLLGKLLVGAMNIAPSAPDAQRLLNFKQARGAAAGHFIEIAYGVIEKRDAQLGYSELTVDNVLSTLAELAESQQARQRDLLRDLLGQMNALEMKWLLRIILRSMHLHVSERSILGAFHPDAVALFNVTNDLRLVCHQLYDPQVRLQAKDQEIRLMKCFKPQKALFKKNAMDNFDGIIARMPRPFYIEEKIDGERLQMHYLDGGAEVRFFSRTGKDYTNYYGNTAAAAAAEDANEDAGRKNDVDNEAVDTLGDEVTSAAPAPTPFRPAAPRGSLAPYLRDFLSSQVRSCILDGEITAWDTRNEEICSLHKIKQAAIGTANNQFQPLFLVFDIVHLNGKDLTSYALRERKRALQRILAPDATVTAARRVELLPYVEATTSEQVRAEFERVTAQMSEGLVVKNPLSRYAVDGRNSSWVKVKPEFLDGYQGENFDMVVIGAQYGQGKKAGILASFLCAVRNEQADQFFSVCRVGNGFSMALYKKIAHLTEGKWRVFGREGARGGVEVPAGVHLGGAVPDEIIDPRESLVLEVKAMQVERSDKFTAGWSLRFPRFVALREDRDYANCLTLSEFMEVQEEFDPAARRRRRQGTLTPSNRRKRLRLQFADNEIEPVAENGIFSGLEFFVGGDVAEPYTLQPELEALLRKHGGQVMRAAGPQSVLVADRRLPRVAAAVDAGERDVVHPRWVFDSVANGRALPREPAHFLSALPSSAAAAAALVDRFGFPLHRRLAPADAARLLGAMPAVDVRSDAELAATLRLLMTTPLLGAPPAGAPPAGAPPAAAPPAAAPPKRGLAFYGTVVYFDAALAPAAAARLGRLVRFGAGTVAVHAGDRSLTHVAAAPDRHGRYAEQAARGVQLVGLDWVAATWDGAAPTA